MKKPESVDAYLATTPAKARGKLKELRAIIKVAAPRAEERISYGMPYYDYKGRLAYFRLATHHIGLYIPTPILAKYKKELKGYATSTATIRLPINKKLPVALIKKLIKARVKLNDERSKK